MDFDRAKAVLRALEANRVPYAVFGGAALNFHGLARFTEDVDLFLEPESFDRRGLASVFRFAHHPTAQAVDDSLNVSNPRRRGGAIPPPL